MAWVKASTSISRFLSKISQGVAAFIIQAYDEVNKKRGLQWEISRILTSASLGEKFYSVLRVGDLDVDLKARVLGASGGGVIGRAYLISASDVTLGSPNRWYNYNSRVDSASSQPKSEIFEDSEITFVTPVVSLAVEANKIHADIYAITNTQNQGKGVVSQSFGGNHILKPDDHILLELESYDSSQDITARIDIYEGGLDFYP